jgi:hypothetical protein
VERDLDPVDGSIVGESNFAGDIQKVIRIWMDGELDGDGKKRYRVQKIVHLGKMREGWLAV